MRLEIQVPRSAAELIPLNGEGLTFEEWSAAANLGGHCTLTRDEQRSEWCMGVDPTEYAKVQD